MKPIRIFALSLGFSAAVIAAIEPPLADPVVDDYYGTEISDAYRYFEDRNDPRIINWSKSTAVATDKHLAMLPDRPRILELLNESGDIKGTSIRSVQRGTDGSLYLQMQRPEDEIEMIFHKLPHQKNRLLVDPRKIVDSKEPLGIKYFSVSPNQKLLAISISSGGSENSDLYVVEIDSGKMVDGPITRTRWGNAFWLPDSLGFVVNRLQNLGPESDPTQKFQKSTVYLHMIDEPVKNDTKLYGFEVENSIRPAAEDLPYIRTINGSDWVAAINSTGVSCDYILHIAKRADLLAGKPNWKKVSDRRQLAGTWNGGGVFINDGKLYVLTRLDAPNGKIVQTSLENPDLESAKTVFEPSKGSIKDVAWARDGLYVKILEGGPSHLIRLPFGSMNKPEKIKTPENSSLNIHNELGFGAEHDGVFLEVKSWTAPSKYFFVRGGDKEARPLDLFEEPSSSSKLELVTRQMMVPSHDGVKVPVSIIHKKGLAMDGKNPVLLIGYGSYGITLEPSLWDSDLALFEMGGIKVVAHLRGGGALGDTWRLAGNKATKPNTWKDFVAVAKALVIEGYTSPGRICASGRSAGGITVGRAITEAPEAFGAALIGVGLSDVIRAETTPNGVPNIPEFGSVKTEDGFRALHAMSPYHHIVDGTNYPPTLIYHGANDTRVELWQSEKMAARLMAAQSSETPILLRIDYKAGHGSGSSKSQLNQLSADMLSFLFAHCRN